MHANTKGFGGSPDSPLGRKRMWVKGNIVTKGRDEYLRYFIEGGFDNHDFQELKRVANKNSLPDKFREYVWEDEWRQYEIGDSFVATFGIADTASQFWRGQNHVSVLDLKFEKEIIPHEYPPLPRWVNWAIDNSGIILILMIIAVISFLTWLELSGY
jgi:hypothetical protein